jgi:hypothetical protein
MSAATRQQRLDHLARAARAKHDAALTRAEAGLRQLIKSGAPVNFRTLAAEAGVSLDFLYRTSQLRERVEALRAQRRRRSPHRQTPASPRREHSPPRPTRGCPRRTPHPPSNPLPTPTRETTRRRHPRHRRVINKLTCTFKSQKVDLDG